MSNATTTGATQQEVDPQKKVRKQSIYRAYSTSSTTEVRDAMRYAVMKNRKCTAKEYGALKSIYYKEAQEAYLILNGEKTMDDL